MYYFDKPRFLKFSIIDVCVVILLFAIIKSLKRSDAEGKRLFYGHVTLIMRYLDRLAICLVKERAKFCLMSLLAIFLRPPSLLHDKSATS